MEADYQVNWGGRFVIATEKKKITQQPIVTKLSMEKWRTNNTEICVCWTLVFATSIGWQYRSPQLFLYIALYKPSQQQKSEHAHNIN